MISSRGKAINVLMPVLLLGLYVVSLEAAAQSSTLKNCTKAPTSPVTAAGSVVARALRPCRRRR